MDPATRSLSFWLITIFLLVSAVLLLCGQTMAVFDYELAVRLGLQEDVGEISEFGVQINRGFGAGDTVVYLPLMIVSVIGLVQRRKWALITTAAVMGISVYWAATAAFMFVFLEGVPGYAFVPPTGYWLAIMLFFSFGLWGLGYIMLRGEKLVQ